MLRRLLSPLTSVLHSKAEGRGGKDDVLPFSGLLPAAPNGIPAGIFLISEQQTILCGGYSDLPSGQGWAGPGDKRPLSLPVDTREVKRLCQKCQLDRNPVAVNVQVHGSAYTLTFHPFPGGLCAAVLSAGSLGSSCGAAGPQEDRPVSFNVSAEELPSLGVVPALPGAAAEARAGRFRRARSGDSLTYSDDSVDGVCAESKEIQVSLPKAACNTVETQTECIRDVSSKDPSRSNSAKPPLPPGAGSAEDAARAMSAVQAHTKQGRKSPWPLEGLWTMVSSNQHQASDPLLRLHFHKCSYVDNSGSSGTLLRLDKYAFLGDGVLSMEGSNLLHRDTASGRRFTYTRGEGGFILGVPVKRDGLHLDFAGPAKHAGPRDLGLEQEILSERSDVRRTSAQDDERSSSLGSNRSVSASSPRRSPSSSGSSSSFVDLSQEGQSYGAARHAK